MGVLLQQSNQFDKLCNLRRCFIGDKFARIGVACQYREDSWHRSITSRQPFELTRAMAPISRYTNYIVSPVDSAPPHPSSNIIMVLADA